MRVDGRVALNGTKRATKRYMLRLQFCRPSRRQVLRLVYGECIGP